MMLRIGVTGGIGSGKSSVCEIFSHLGIPVFHADLEARKLYGTHEGLKQQILNYFGADVYENGILNRQKLSQIVFSDPDKLRALNGMVHPIIFDLYESWCKQNNNHVYTRRTSKNT